MQPPRATDEPRSSARRGPRAARIVSAVVAAGVIVFALTPTGCYLSRAGWEEAKILGRRRPIAAIVKDSAVDTATRAKLRLVLEARDYARYTLRLDVDYRVIKALNKIRIANPNLSFDGESVLTAVRREREESRRLNLCLKSLQTGPSDHSALDLATRAIRERLDQKLKQVRWMLGNGYPIEAGEAVERLSKSIKGWPERESQLAGLSQELETPEMQLELEAQKALQKIERKVFEDPDVRWVKHLQKIVEKYPRTKTAERAQKLAKIAAV